MKWSTLAVAMAVSVAPIAFQSQASAHSDKDARDIRIRGCVIAGEKKGTFALSHVSEVPSAGEHAMPEWAHGRRVVYWLKDLKNLGTETGRMVEVRGTLEKFEKSEIEMKAGRQKNGELFVEFEGPGADVTVPNSAVGAAIGTAGRTTPEKTDIKTMLAVISVKEVMRTHDSCQ